MMTAAEQPAIQVTCTGSDDTALVQTLMSNGQCLAPGVYNVDVPALSATGRRRDAMLTGSLCGAAAALTTVRLMPSIESPSGFIHCSCVTPLPIFPCQHPAIHANLSKGVDVWRAPTGSKTVQIAAVTITSLPIMLDPPFEAIMVELKNTFFAPASPERYRCERSSSPGASSVK